MTDLATDWVGLRLSTPFVVGASPLTDDLDALRRCVECGAGAIVMRSLFEEQIVAEQLAAHRLIDSNVDMDAEARTFLPDSHVFGLGSAPYLAILRKLRNALDVPVIASLNGTSPGGWVDLARDLAAAGAAAIELNLYDIATSFTESAADLESRQLVDRGFRRPDGASSRDRQALAVLFVAAGIYPRDRRDRCTSRRAIQPVLSARCRSGLARRQPRAPLFDEC